MKSTEIAKLANVSRSTVSRVINNYSNVPEETRQRVMKVIEENHYIPNSSARNLAGKSSNVITLFIYDEEAGMNYTPRWRGTNSSYYVKLIAELVDAAKKRNFIVSVYVLTRQSEYEYVATLFRSKSISWGIFAEFETQKEQLERLIQQGFSMVILEPPESLESSENTFCICSDDENGAYAAVQYLISKGHRRIGHIMGDDRVSSRNRLHGYRRAMEENELSIRPEWIQPGLFQEEASYQATRYLIEKEDITALFVANDAMAVSVLHALRDTGKSTPDDISVVGFDNSEVLHYLRTELTTVEVSLRELAENVMKQICGETNLKFCICPAKLIEKKTVKNISI